MKALMTFPILWIALFLVSSPAPAQDFSAGLGTEFPLGVSLNAATHFPESEIWLRTRYGRFLPPYVRAMNSISESLGLYNSAASDLINEGLGGAWLLEFGAGWEQSPVAGWFVDLAYTYVRGSGRVAGATILAAVGSTLPSGGNIYDLESTVHSLGLRGGYRWSVGKSFTVAATAGLVKPIDSTTSLNRDVTGAIQRALLDAVSSATNTYLNDIYKNSVWIPVLGVSLAYRFQFL